MISNKQTICLMSFSNLRSWRQDSQTILKDDTSCKHASSATQGTYIKIDKHNIYMITKITLKTRWSQIALSCGAAFAEPHSLNEQLRYLSDAENSVV
jgi:hypothetical protein